MFALVPLILIALASPVHAGARPIVKAKPAKASVRHKKKKPAAVAPAPPVLIPPETSSLVTSMTVLDPAIAIAPSYTTEEEKLQAVLSFVFFNDARKYGWPSNYTAMWCPTNAFHLLKRLQQAGVDLTGAEVWYLIPSDSANGSGESVIYPRQARPVGASTISEWAFHVVISVKGRILDLDFTAQPQVLLQVQYAAQMWQKGPLARPQEDQRPLFVRKIPATDYLQQYTDNWFYYVSGGNGRYPAVEMSTLFPSVSKPGLGQRAAQ